MDSMFNNVDFGPLKKYLDDDDIIINIDDDALFPNDFIKIKVKYL